MTEDVLRRVSEEYGTPTFVFDITAFKERLRACGQILGPNVGICFAMKANPFLAPAAADVADRLEVCSPGELDICIRSGIDAGKVVYSGVNKGAEDIARALDYGVDVITLESLRHAKLVNAAATERGIVVDVLPRLNSGSQFGMSKEDLLGLVRSREDYPGMRICGIHYFVGTQRRKIKHQVKELGMLSDLIDELREGEGLALERLEYGPGLAVPYFEDEDFSDDLEPLRAVAPKILELAEKIRVTVEMGRFFSASCGAYLTSAVDLKSNEGTNYCILDGGSNHLVYAGQMMGLHVPVIKNLSGGTRDGKEATSWCLCGSLCSVMDVLVRSCTMDLAEGDVLAFMNAGAYSVTEGIHLFLSRTMPRVVFVEGDGETRLVRDFVETSALNAAHPGDGA